MAAIQQSCSGRSLNCNPAGGSVNRKRKIELIYFIQITIMETAVTLAGESLPADNARYFYGGERLET